jgi:YYY domain-containing protein
LSGSPSTPTRTSETKTNRARVAWWLALGVIVVIGASARLWNLDWDDGQHLHPDERHWSFVLDSISAPDSIPEYFATGESPLDPYTKQPSFVYGTLPLFTTKAVAAALEAPSLSPVVTALDAVGVDLRRSDGTLRFDGGYGANLIGRLLSALADTVTIILVGCLGRLLAGRLAGLAGAGYYALAVIAIQQSHFLGPDAFATMFATAAALTTTLHVRRGNLGWLLGAGALVGAATACRVHAVVLLLAVGVGVVLAAPPVDRLWGEWRTVGRLIGRFAAAVALAALVFRVAQPSAFDGWWLNQVWVDDLRALRDLQAGADVPPALQWVGRTRLVYPLGQLVVWGIGPTFSVAALLGGWVLWKRRERAALVPAVVIVSFLALIASTWTPTLRYLMPVVPLAAAAAGVGLVHLVAAARSLTGRRRQAVWVAVGVLAVTTIGWGAAFVNGVYGHTHSRIAATEWITANVAPGSTLSIDAWDDGLPLGFPDTPAFEFVELEPFAPDSPQKIEQLVDRLGRIDLVVVSSQRARASVERLPARYPSTLRYYESLADGSLGFDRVASFHNLPALGPLRIDTTSAEEAFSVYDHPPVELYRRTERFSTETARRILDPAIATTALSPPLLEGGANALLATPAERAKILDGDTFDELFPHDGLGAAVLWISGWIVFAAASVAWSTRLLPRSSAGAAALTLVLGPLAVTVVVWSLVAWGAADLSTWLIRFVAGAYVVLGGTVGWRDRRTLVRRILADRAAWTTVAAVAASAFGAVVALRLGNPDLWHPARGGEKPMELAYFTSVARSSTVPPPDPWFGGGVLNYYYLGYFHLAMPARALGVAPEVAFGLGLATIVASATAIAAAVGHDIAQLASGPRRLGTCAPRVAAVVSAAGLLVVGNLDAARQALGGAVGSFDWWRTSRVHTGTLDVTEFPAWSILFGDLHPHVMGLWLTGLCVLVGVALVTDARSGESGGRRLALLGLLGLVVGLVQMTHTWDLPAVVLLTAGAVGLARPQRSPRPAWNRVAGAIGIDLAVVGGVALLFTTPYRRRSTVFNDGVDRAPVTTDLTDQLIHLGVWWGVAAAFAIVLFAAGRPASRPSSPRSRMTVVGTVLTGVGSALVIVGLGLVVSWVAAVSLVLVAMLVGGVAVEAGRRRLDPALTITTGLLTAGVALAALPELVIVSPDIERLNTVFKLTFQSWHLFALAAGPAVVVIASCVTRRSVRAPGLVLIAASLAAVLAFPVLAVRPRLADRPITTTGPTLDGLAYLSGTWSVGAPNGAPITPADDRVIVDWLRHEVAGQPTIVEMVGQAYGWNARISVMTGLPTVLGWPWHETQQRLGFADAVAARFADVERLYTATDEEAAAFFLRAHRVEFVVIGTLELAMGTPETLAMLETLPGAEVVVRDGERRLIEIDQSLLAADVARRTKPD